MATLHVCLTAFVIIGWCGVAAAAHLGAQTTASRPQKPGTQTTKPDTETAKPGTQTPKPGTQTPKPRTPTPADDKTDRREVKEEADAIAISPAVKERVKSAKAAQATGGFRQAVDTYETALKEASDPTTRAHVSISFAQALESWVQSEPPTKDPEQTARLTRAAQLYRAALDTGTPAQRQLARNNLGALQLRQGQYKEAVKTLEALDTKVEPGLRFLYEYNLGRAHELAENSDEAFTRYVNAIRAQPTFAPPRQGALQILLAARPVNMRRAEELGTLLLARGQPNESAHVARVTLRAATSDDVDAMFGLLARSYVAVSLEPATFQRDERPMLESLTNKRAQQLAQELERAVSDPGLPVLTTPRGAQEFFGAWRPQWASLAALLKHVGDVYGREERYSQALARYAAAWVLDRTNGEPAVYAAMLLHEHPEIDPEQRVLNLLLADIFDAKSDFLGKEDWPNSLRMHLMLGEIFEKLGRWGPEDEPRSATFQWRAALRAEEKILERDRSFVRSAGLYLKLGNGYLRLDTPKPELAREQFLNAARAFEETGRKAEAAAARERARVLQPVQ